MQARGEGSPLGAAEAAGTPRRRRVHRSVVAVLLVGLAATGALVYAARTAGRHNDKRLLTLQTKLTAAALQAEPLYVEDHLGDAANVAAATGGRVATFKAGLAGSVGTKATFVDAALWSINGGPHVVAEMGAKPLLDPSSPRAAQLVEAATGRSTFVVERIAAGHDVRLAYAIAPSGALSGYVAYAEEALPASRRITVPARSPIGELHVVLYPGDPTHHGVLLETDSTVPLPLTGETATARVPFGSRHLTLVLSPRGPLAGSISPYVPWGIAVIGALIALAVAVAIEWLLRRREGAESRAAESERRLRIQREMSRTLQHSLLPEALPTRKGVELASRYLPGAEDTEVGGDWYDVVEVDPTHLFVAVGDVCGRGLRAAALMGTLRNAVNAYALEGHDPATVLQRISPMVSVRDGRFATVLCGRLDTVTGALTLASAGHLSPLLVRPGAGCDSEVTYVDLPVGPPIGVSNAADEAAVVELGDDATLVAFTDGLVERRGESLTDGLDRLRAAVAAASAAGGTTLDTLTDAAVDAMGAAAAADDVAILALRRLAGVPAGGALPGTR